MKKIGINMTDCIRSLLINCSHLKELFILSNTSKQNLACTFGLPQGGTNFQLVPLGSPQEISWANLTPDKHKVSAPNAPHQKVIQIIRPCQN